MGGILGPADADDTPETTEAVVDEDTPIDVGGTVPFPKMYMFSRLGPPQYSL